jgi:hypothetical protein
MERARATEGEIEGWGDGRAEKYGICEIRREKRREGERARKRKRRGRRRRKGR